MIDTHCHLNHPKLLEKTAQLLHDAAQVGVTKIIVPSWDEDSSRNAMKLAVNYPNVIYPAIGVHPWFPPKNGYSFIEDICRESTPIAIGEIGIDKSARISIVEQMTTFTTMIDIARKYDLPVIIHARGGWEIILETLREKPVRGVMHAYSGSVEMMQKFILAGMQISFAASLTRPNNKKTILCAEAVSLHSMMIETDAPGMAVYGLTRGQGTPENLPVVVGTMAEIRRMPIYDIIMHSDANARELFGIKM
ncbi:MAG: TatD family hydrolase [bacterium]